MRMRRALALLAVVVLLVVACYVGEVGAFDRAKSKRKGKGAKGKGAKGKGRKSRKRRSSGRKQARGAAKKAQEQEIEVTATGSLEADESEFVSGGDASASAHNVDSEMRPGRSGSKSTSSGSGGSGSSFKFQLEHALTMSSDGDSGDVFSPRGSIEVTFLRGKQVKVDSSSVQTSLSSDDLTKLKKLALERGFYRLRIPARTGAGEEAYTMASIPACALALGNFQESLWLHLDRRGNLAGFDYSSPSAESVHCDADTVEHIFDGVNEASTKTSVMLARSRQAHKPSNRLNMVANPPPGMEHLKVKTKADEEAAQPSFFRRYWYIIVPAAFLLLSGGGGG